MRRHRAKLGAPCFSVSTSKSASVKRRAYLPEFLKIKGSSVAVSGSMICQQAEGEEESVEEVEVEVEVVVEADEVDAVGGEGVEVVEEEEGVATRSWCKKKMKYE